MGYVSKRKTGRSWRLKERSMELWPELLSYLNTTDNPIRLETPLIQLARSENEVKMMENMVRERKDLELELIQKNDLKKLNPPCPINEFGGLISENDGRIDPIKLLFSLINALERDKIRTTNKKVRSLKRLSSKWLLFLDDNVIIEKDCIIICAAGGSTALLQQLGYSFPIEPVLGQVIRLSLESHNEEWSHWPAVLISNGINLIPQSKNKLLIGATIEPGFSPSKKYLQNMKEMHGQTAEWMKNATIETHWQGIRFKPSNEPAPLLKNIEHGLILNTAHYRNGILLAPACAEWVANELMNS